MFNNIFELTKAMGIVKRKFGFWTNNECTSWTSEYSCSGRFCYHANQYQNGYTKVTDDYSKTGALYNYTDGDWSKYAYTTITRTGTLEGFRHCVKTLFSLDTTHYDYQDGGIANLRNNWYVQFWGGTASLS